MSFAKQKLKIKLPQNNSAIAFCDTGNCKLQVFTNYNFVPHVKVILSTVMILFLVHLLCYKLIKIPT